MRRGAAQVWGGGSDEGEDQCVSRGGAIDKAAMSHSLLSWDLLSQVTSHRSWWLYPKLVADGKGQGRSPCCCWKALLDQHSICKRGMVAQGACNPSTQGGGGRRIRRYRLAWATREPASK